MCFKLSLLIIFTSLLSMNTYSRALRYISIKDVKQKHQEKLIEQKIQEEKKKEEEKYIASIMEEKKYDWRKELNEQMTTSDIFFATLPATGDLTISSNDFSDPDTYLFSSSVSGTDVVMVSREDSAPIVGANYTNLRQVRTGNIDTSKSTTIVVSVTKPTSDFPTWQDRDPLENFNDNISVVAYSNSNPIETSVTLSSNFDGTQTFTLPSNLIVSDLRIQFSQFGLMPVPGDPSSGQPNATIRVITTQRQTPMNVFVPLDSPEAVSFVRTGSGDLSPEEKQKRLKKMLEASDEYVRQMYGNDFPGVGATPPGESRFTPQQLSDIDKQIQDLQAQSEKNKQDAVNNKWKAAAELGLGVAGVVGGIGVAAKIPAAIRAAKTVSQVRQATKAYNTHKALEAIRKAADVKRMTTPGKYTGTPRPGGTTPKGGGMYKS